MSKFILAIDQGTTSSRALVFDLEGNIRGIGQQEFTQHFPANGWVEHEPEEIWTTTVDSCKTALTEAGTDAASIACIGITNQRETTIVWDRATGAPVYNAIVWQDRRTAAFCQELKERGLEPKIQEKTGLLLDPYFSASKLRWILDQTEGVRERAERGELAFGTVDSYLLWKLTGGNSHCTDATNASRTMLFNIETQDWDDELLKIFNIPRNILPEVKDCSSDFGSTDQEILGATIPITGIMGDQQAAAFGQCCFTNGTAKSTYGTGCFLLMNTGSDKLTSSNRLLTTVAYRMDGKVSYAMEGSIFMAGATMQWIRDELKLVDHAADSEALAEACNPDLGVYLVPAFTGLGAPYWDPDARGAIFGMTRNTGVAEIVTAALMSVCFQTRDLVDAIRSDGAILDTLRVDGGMVANNFMLQRLADVLGCEVHRPVVTETTALGAAYAAGLQQGIFDNTDNITARWQLERAFSPQQDDAWRNKQYRGWQEAVKRTRSN
ncbi:MAG: glycerol kinase GlpK [Gammaproteobacteria bacterium]